MTEDILVALLNTVIIQRKTVIHSYAIKQGYWMYVWSKKKLAWILVAKLLILC